MKGISLYIHIPFCKSKCSYCNFVSYTNCEKYFDKYINSLIKEIKIRSKECKNCEIKTIYVGGGTPSILPLGSISKIVNSIKKSFLVVENAEITVEANPNSLTLEKAIEWQKCGVNRVSVGLQASNKKLLKILKRPHNYKDFENAICFLKKAGIYNISADIMIGLPKQNWFDVRKTLKKVFKNYVTHISAYGLILEENTPLFDEVKKGKYKMPSDNKSVMIYKKTCKKLEKNGFLQYEISNFSQKGFESKHNLNYWNRGEFIGFGVGAFSFFDGVHWENTEQLNQYLKNPNNKLNIEKETLDSAKKEFIMLSLRTTKGLNIFEYTKRFKTHFIKDYEKQILKLLKNRSIVVFDGYVKVLKPEILNLIIQEFF